MLALSLGCKPGSKEQKPNGSASIRLADIKLESADGKRLEVASLQGNVVFLNFWATWCKPCLAEMPGIVKTRDSLHDARVVFLFASDEPWEEINAFAEKRKLDIGYYRVLNLEALHVQALPTTLIFDTRGTATFAEPGYRDWSTPENVRLITEGLK
ncbi:MAG: TlpA family protein disulfide reductase [Bacteroidia bacterium]|nr:TlpA family protein disulfide reductase [Bacteroidia bacterium]